MKYQTHKEKITAIHLWVKKQRDRCALARNRTPITQKKIMLGGKVKAYTDVLCLLQARYKKELS